MRFVKQAGTALAMTLAMLVAGGCGDDPAGIDRDIRGLDPSFAVAASDPLQVGTGEGGACYITGGLVSCFTGSGLPTIHASASSSFTQVSVGPDFGCALNVAGQAECWGANHVNQAPPLQSAFVGTFTQIATGGFHGCALRTDGLFQCWGWEGMGAVSSGKAAASGSFVQVTAGANHTCALRDDGVVECIGDNTYGQAPATKTAASGVFTRIDAGGNQTCAVRSDGRIECWGNNDTGQAPPLVSASDRSFVSVGVGAANGCGVRADGVVECWGVNVNGEAPVSRSAVSSRYAQIAPSDGFTCAMRRNGTVECFGDEAYDISAPPPSPLGFEVVMDSYTQFTLAADPPASGLTHTVRYDRRAQGGDAWGPWTVLGNESPGDGLIDNTAQPNNRYQYRVRACNPAGCSVPSSSRPLATAPALSDIAQQYASNDGISITVTWGLAGCSPYFTCDPQAWHFELRRRTRVSGGAWSAWQDLPNVNGDFPVYTESPLSDNTYYQYRIRACNAAGCNAWAATTPNSSNADLPNPPAEANVQIEIGSLVINWWDQSLDETGFQLQRRVENSTTSEWDPWITVARDLTDPFHIDEGLPPGTYQYRVRACNDAGCSVFDVTNTAILP